MAIWLTLLGFAFLAFIVGLIMLFAQSKRKIGIYVVSGASLIIIASIIGIFISFGNYTKLQQQVATYSSDSKNGNTKSEGKETYNVNWHNNADGMDKKISTVAVEKKVVHSTMEDKDMPGTLTIAIEIKNNTKNELLSYPLQGELTTVNGQQLAADIILSDLIDGKMKPGATIKGTIVFPLDKLDKVSDIEWFEFSWSTYNKDKLLKSDTGRINLKK
ncbi:hypothetical protein BMT55_05540 [Listeria newyorkensis]|uniref:DUF4352 domain-containing protein n=1 Tax=Listeria newyorkensis TaxID=1497681 RepID=A0ABX4XQ66_9LIST|nr:MULTISPECIES: DUF4352 domain-containing protein [Listeria]KGL45284.1 hypothetical protein EP56_06930 [Listeriaceae bacterium FSL A5-0209]KGL40178.1 hypothetical protein EP58_13575 [Listeria newyorkensis]KMT63426.1 hypothetical protein X559_0194 [Listeria newyorkensis]PNP93456.1 hypothetical protein BMT55_05540 [Listeria newyorkensis]RQW68083.1 DUF4352 domain-containing protein [Listeria sp. SHR_NRA_18]